MNQALLYMVVLAFMYAFWQLSLWLLKCHYCGQIRVHEPHCPYNTRPK